MKARRERSSGIFTSLILSAVTLGTFGALREGPTGVVERFHKALSQPQIQPVELQACLAQSIHDPYVGELIDDVYPRLRSKVPYRVVQTTFYKGFYLVDVTYEARPEFPARGISWVVVKTDRGPLIDAYTTLSVLRQPLR